MHLQCVGVQSECLCFLSPSRMYVCVCVRMPIHHKAWVVRGDGKNVLFVRFFVFRPIGGKMKKSLDLFVRFSGSAYICGVN